MPLSEAVDVRSSPSVCCNTSTRSRLFTLPFNETQSTKILFAPKSVIFLHLSFSHGDSSQDPLILCVGPRRLRVKPIYSQYAQGGARGVNNVHKFERYLRHGDTYVATIYAPILFGYQPCALLREIPSANSRSPLSPGRMRLMSFHSSSIPCRDGLAAQP
jgi:40S ribosome biogenesis protein Tsr1 and BMS1 C-terminal